MDLKNRFDLSLYAIADASVMSVSDAPALVESAIRGGVTAVQVRAKDLDDSEFVDGAAGEDSDALGKVDLLTVLAHELGHVLGQSHSDDPASPLSPFLTVGTRKPVGADVFEGLFETVLP